MLKKIYLYFNTIKYMKPSQIVYRLYYYTKIKMSRFFPTFIQKKYTNESDFLSLNRKFKFFRGFIELDIDDKKMFKKDIYESEDILNNKFEFLNVKKNYKQSIDWQDKANGKLWLYNLHYHDYLLKLGISFKVTSEVKYFHKFKDIVKDWIEKNPIGQGDGWEPYTLSLRIVNWIKCYYLFYDVINNEEDLKKMFLKSLYIQSVFLSQNIEYHLRANHLFENITALMYASLFFEGKWAQKCYQNVHELFHKEVAEQFLDDGGHFERSPMYHSIILLNLVELVELLKLNNRSYDKKIDSKLKKGFKFLNYIIHPDGQIPLFNDSAFGVALPPSELLPIAVVMYNSGNIKQKAPYYSKTAFLLYGRLGQRKFDDVVSLVNSKSIQSFKETGYFIIKDECTDSKMIIKCGEIGPGYNPGHAHCDVLSYELSIYGRRFIVDSGVFEYSGEYRNNFRSTAAHNTVEIDCCEQSDIWGEFRVANRVKGINSVLEDFGQEIVFFGMYDGYKRLKNKVAHKRHIKLIDKTWVIKDDLEGYGSHTIKNRIHFHPNCKVRKLSDNILVATYNDVNLIIILLGNALMYIEQSYYSQEFGLKNENNVICMKHNIECPYSMTYILYPYKGEIRDVSYKVEGKKIFLSINDKIIETNSYIRENN